MIAKAAEHQWPEFDRFLLLGLELAVQVAHVTVIELLLGKVKIELLAQPSRDNVFHHAARGTSHGTTRFLLQKLSGICPHNASGYHGMLPLHIAASSGNINAVEALLEVDCTAINARDENGNTPLHLAAINDVAEACLTLLAAAADNHARNKEGLTPWAIALKQQSSDAARAITMYPTQMPDHIDDVTKTWIDSQP